MPQGRDTVQAIRTYRGISSLRLTNVYLHGPVLRHGRDEDGWMIPKQLQDDAEELDNLPPPFVKCVTRLKCDVEALLFLTCRSDPPEAGACAPPKSVVHSWQCFKT